MDTKKRIISGVVLLCALTLLFFVMRGMYMRQMTVGFTYELAGFSFPYHPQFIVEEKINNGSTRTVTLMPRTPTSPQAVAGEVEPRMQCIIFNNTENRPLMSWVESEDHATLAGVLMSSTTYPSTDIPGKEAVGFKTDGLYVSDHVAFENKGHFIDCSVEYITLDDPLRMNFVTFISNIKLSSE